MTNEMILKELKERGYIFTDIHVQEVDEDEDYYDKYVMTNGRNFVFQDGTTLTDETIKELNRLSRLYYEQDWYSNLTQFMPIITVSEPVNFSKQIMLENGEIKDIEKIYKNTVRTTDGILYANEYIKFL